MQKIAVGIILFGLAFTFFSIFFAGIDILIDAVGFLFVFNGTWALRKKVPLFAKAACLSLVLVVVSSAQLFAFSALATGVLLLRLILNLVLMLILGLCFFRLFML